MPIRLAAPTVQSPDGKGWNRLSVGSCWTPSPQCTLRPRGYTHLWESLYRSRVAQWGSYGPCIDAEAFDDRGCDTCAVATREHKRLPAAARLPFRIDPDDGEPWLMHRLDDGWGERGKRWTWQDLRQAMPAGWGLEGSQPHRDEHGQFFWVVRTT